MSALPEKKTEIIRGTYVKSFRPSYSHAVHAACCLSLQMSTFFLVSVFWEMVHSISKAYNKGKGLGQYLSNERNIGHL